MYPLTESFYGVFLSVVIILGLLIFGEKLPSIKPFSLHIIILLAISVFINFNYSFGIYEEFDTKKKIDI